MALPRISLVNRFTGLVLLWATCAGYRAASFPEYQVKAAYLFNFARFVEWPKTAFETPDAPLVIGIVGADPFGRTLEETLEGKTVQGRPFRIERVQALEKISKLHLLFIARSEKDRVPEILAKTEGWPVLTVSEMDDFAKERGMIQLRVADQQITFDLNQKAIKKAGLIPSVQMIKIAKVVRY